MNCTNIQFSRHAFERMFERELSPIIIEQAIGGAEVIKHYPDDTPFPTTLLLAFNNQTPLHLVIAQDPITMNCIVVTVYVPNPTLWDDDFKQRRTV